ncbi:hypothetical protein RF11_07532 [Thelohanellus kitauei]|uniref:Uncharacterized protein n=1 Tax=Thelohanellus kitauei TaxID=669202 RepID=A0A0C2MC36_THEKT|nr:hypothetical protein RF11_07532 [Thelohanellus kitauei]
MLFPVESIEDAVDQMTLSNYARITKEGDVSNMMESVRSVMNRFPYDYKHEYKRFFLRHFPNELFHEFILVIEFGKAVHQYQEKKLLFFDVFNFIFRDYYLLATALSRPFLQIFIKFIRSRDTINTPNPGF